MTGDAAARKPPERKPVYPAEQRKEALRLHREVGPAKASRECGIPAATIRSWAYREGVSTTVPPSEQTRAATDAARRSWAQRRLELSEQTGAAAADLLERIRRAKRATDVRALATAYAALVEKGQLLDGSVTSRVEVEGGDRLERVKAIRDDLAMRREAKTG